jgi:ribosomal protein L24E
MGWNSVLSRSCGITVLACFVSAALTGAAQAETCPFCSAASQTLRQESLSMDAVAIAHLVSDGRIDIDGNATFEIESILRGGGLLEIGQKVEAVYFGPGKSDKKFLLLGVDPRNLVWSSPLPLSVEAVQYVESIQSLPEDPVARLDFYQKHFENPDSLLARDSYDEFALAPYEDVKKLKDKMDRKQLLEWVRDPSKSPDRKRLYYTMLGICGQPDDADEFEDMIESQDPEKRAGLDALIAAYLMLKGEDGLKLIDEQFLANRKASYPDVYSSVMALRFHGTEANVIPKEAILRSMRHLLDAPDLADLVIPDLARWSDWSQIDRLTELFKNANDDNSWVRVPVVNYLRACPLPEAKVKLEELEKIDPKAVKRAATFFPIPAPAAKPKQDDQSSWSPLMPFGAPIRGQLAQSSEKRLAITNQVLWGWQWSGSPLPVGNASIRNADSPPIAAVQRMNSFRLMSVISIAGFLMSSLMWMVAAGMFTRELAFLQISIHGYIHLRRS